MKRLLFILMLFISTVSFAQQAEKKTKQIPISVSVFNNAAQMPFGGTYLITSVPVHPGISFSTEYQWNKSAKNRIFQTFNLAYFFHRFSEHGIMAYSEIAYMHMFKPNFGLGMMLGFGYEHSIADFPIYTMKNGKYERTKRFGRSQLMGSISMEVDYKPNCFPFPLFFKYQFWMHGPYAANYVPVMPSTAVHFGVKINFTKS
jgi:hypothetical protein